MTYSELQALNARTLECINLKRLNVRLRVRADFAEKEVERLTAELKGEKSLADFALKSFAQEVIDNRRVAESAGWPCGTCKSVERNPDCGVCRSLRGSR